VKTARARAIELGHLRVGAPAEKAHRRPGESAQRRFLRTGADDTRRRPVRVAAATARSTRLYGTRAATTR
jgi:hypothetical protein